MREDNGVGIRILIGRRDGDLARIRVEDPKALKKPANNEEAGAADQSAVALQDHFARTEVRGVDRIVYIYVGFHFYFWAKR